MARGTVGSRRPKHSPPKAKPPVGHPPPSHRLALLRLVHPFPSLLVSAVTVALAFLADRHGSRLVWAQLGAGMLLFQFSIGVTNDVVDAADDAVSKPWKALPLGAIRRERAVLVAAACAAGGMIVTFTLPLDAWLIGVAGLACGLLYDLALKRTRLSWLPYAVAIPLVPAWVYTAIGAWRGLLWWTFPLGGLLGLSLHLANQLPDLERDGNRGITSTVQRAGARRSYTVALAAFGFAASVAAVVLAFESARGALLVALDGVTAALLAPRATRFFGRDGLFGLLAAATAILGVVFVSAV